MVLLNIFLWSTIEQLVSARRIVVLGGNGKTAQKVIQLGLQGNNKVAAVTRSGTFTGTIDDTKRPNLINIKGDVTDLTSIQNAVRGADACVFAASASKSGGTPTQVDRDGLINTAKACIAEKVPRLIVVSSGAVTKPYSPVYLFLNLFGGIMRAKFEGETELKRLYQGLYKDSSSQIGYTIFRPGGLTEEPPVGCLNLELGQGDEKSGRISRWDVAALCLNSLDSSDTFDTTIECYNADTAKPLSEVGLSNIFGMKKAPSEIVSRRSDSWSELFKGLKKD